MTFSTAAVPSPPSPAGERQAGQEPVRPMIVYLIQCTYENDFPFGRHPQKHLGKGPGRCLPNGGFVFESWGGPVCRALGMGGFKPPSPPPNFPQTPQECSPAGRSVQVHGLQPSSTSKCLGRSTQR